MGCLSADDGLQILCGSAVDGRLSTESAGFDEKRLGSGD